MGMGMAGMVTPATISGNIMIAIHSLDNRHYLDTLDSSRRQCHINIKLIPERNLLRPLSSRIARLLTVVIMAKIHANAHTHDCRSSG